MEQAVQMVLAARREASARGRGEHRRSSPRPRRVIRHSS